MLTGHHEKTKERRHNGWVDPKHGLNGISANGASQGRPAMAVECRGLVKNFDDVAAVNSLDLTVPAGTTLSLLGPSGCGKTTVLRLIAGFEDPSAGTVAIGGRLVFGDRCGVPPEKRRVGMVFQEGALFPHLTVEQNVSYGLSKNGGRQARTKEVLELVGLYGLRQRMPHELSGGQQQRVALGRALAPSPDVLLLDEPFSNLDAGLREQVRRDVREILQASASATVFVTHDQEEALFMGNAVAVMRDGRVEQAGPPESIYHRPRTKFVAQFVGAGDFLPAWREGDRMVTEVGSGPWPDISLPEQDLEVMVRPDCLECRPSDRGQGVIVEREFRGAFYLYWVALASGRTVRCLVPHPEEFPVGTTVRVSLRFGHPLRPFPQADP